MYVLFYLKYKSVFVTARIGIIPFYLVMRCGIKINNC
jgi:hypothetical protein